MAEASQKPSILVVCGPTAVGKTSAAIAIAEAFGGEIVGADSMQIYRCMDIGTAKPSAEEQARVPHHMIDIVSPDEDFDAARYVFLARPLVFELCRRGVLPVVAGGTGLYIKALIHGLFDARPPDPVVRRQLQAEAAAAGAAVLHQRLGRIDPPAAARIHPNDAFRIIRALETYEQTGRVLSEHHRRHGFPDPPFRVFKIGLTMQRESLYRRIDRRVERMIAAGLLPEVQDLLKRGYAEGLKSMQAIGYRHMVAHLRGEMDWDETVRTLKRDTRRYAKRQFTWFKADPAIAWIEPHRVAELYPQIQGFIDRGRSPDRDARSPAR
jgi:tRNA dimethylallyltransferase